MTYVELGPVRTWYGEAGAGAPLLFLHPGGVDSRSLDVNVAALASQFRVLTPERRGHGRTPDVDPMTFDAMASDMILFLETVVGGPARLGGCSDGAVVALMVALRRPDLVERLACVAGVFHRDGWGGGVSDLEAGEPPQFMADMYGELSPDGIGHYPEIVRKLDDMHRAHPALAPSDLAALSVRTLVMIGDDDEVSIEHAAEFFRNVPTAELAVVPGTSHGLLVEKPALCNAILSDFFTNDAVETFAPIRRA